MRASKRRTNPRYVAYAKAHGRSPREMMAHDRDAYPGGHMVGFMFWIQDRWMEFDTETGRKRDLDRGSNDHREFDEWLSRKVTG